jgi:hypothetical protein
MAKEMRAITKKHLSVREGKARFAEVTVAVLDDETERLRTPELFLNDRRVVHPEKKDEALIDSAVTAVSEEASARGLSLCVMRIESSYVDAHPEAVRLAALSAVAALTTKE